MSQDCLVAFGSNVGDSDGCYAEICSMWNLDPNFDSVVASSLVTTQPIGGSANQNQYRNGCIRFQYLESMQQLFTVLINVEERFGRTRRQRWGARTVDLDLLLFGTEQMDSDSLQIPHPRMSFRRFVLQPAAEIAGDMINPVSGLSLKQHLSLLNSRPDRIAFATNEPDDFQESIQPEIVRYQQLGWQFEIISETQQIRSGEHNIKLLVYFQDLPSELLEAARRFRGATLDATSGSGCVDWPELAAAVAAMSSC